MDVGDIVPPDSTNDKLENVVSKVSEKGGLNDFNYNNNSSLPTSSVFHTLHGSYLPDDDGSILTPEHAFVQYQTKSEDQACQICGQPAVGFHHRAYVCEACKKFFMRHTTARLRNSETNSNLTESFCPMGGRCRVEGPGRGKCPHCRYRKCLELGMSLTPPGGDSGCDISQIPCRVCGGPSSGFHFGALTCEGCKGFFRRTVLSNVRLECLGNNDCPITPANRNMCKSCRFQRCLQVGMSKNGSRIGRQPNAIKYYCAREISQLSTTTTTSPATECDLNPNSTTPTSVTTTPSSNSTNYPQASWSLASPNDSILTSPSSRPDLVGSCVDSAPKSVSWTVPTTGGSKRSTTNAKNAGQIHEDGSAQHRLATNVKSDLVIHSSATSVSMANPQPFPMDSVLAQRQFESQSMLDDRQRCRSSQSEVAGRHPVEVGDKEGFHSHSMAISAESSRYVLELIKECGSNAMSSEAMQSQMKQHHHQMVQQEQAGSFSGGQFANSSPPSGASGLMDPLHPNCTILSNNDDSNNQSMLTSNHPYTCAVTISTSSSSSATLKAHHPAPVTMYDRQHASMKDDSYMYVSYMTNDRGQKVPQNNVMASPSQLVLPTLGQWEADQIAALSPCSSIASPSSSTSSTSMPLKHRYVKSSRLCPSSATPNSNHASLIAASNRYDLNSMNCPLGSQTSSHPAFDNMSTYTPTSMSPEAATTTPWFAAAAAALSVVMAASQSTNGTLGGQIAGASPVDTVRSNSTGGSSVAAATGSSPMVDLNAYDLENDNRRVFADPLANLSKKAKVDLHEFGDFNPSVYPPVPPQPSHIRTSNLFTNPSVLTSISNTLHTNLSNISASMANMAYANRNAETPTVSTPSNYYAGDLAAAPGSGHKNDATHSSTMAAMKAAAVAAAAAATAAGLVLSNSRVQASLAEDYTNLTYSSVLNSLSDMAAYSTSPSLSPKQQLDSGAPPASNKFGRLNEAVDHHHHHQQQQQHYQRQSYVQPQQPFKANHLARSMSQTNNNVTPGSSREIATNYHHAPGTSSAGGSDPIGGAAQESSDNWLNGAAPDTMVARLKKGLIWAALATKHFAERTHIAAKYMISERKNIHNDFPKPCRSMRMTDSTEEVWQHMMRQFEIHSRFIVRFVKHIPGFNSLNLCDQRQLVRTSMYPLMLLELSCDYDKDNFNYFDFTPAERNIILTHFPTFRVISDHLVRSGEFINRLRLDNIELTLLCAHEVFKTRQDLEDPHTPEQLCYLVERELADHIVSMGHCLEERLALLDQISPLLYELNMQHHAVISKLRQDNPHLNFPQLYLEMFQMTEDEQQMDDSNQKQAPLSQLSQPAQSHQHVHSHSTDSTDQPSEPSMLNCDRMEVLNTANRDNTDHHHHPQPQQQQQQQQQQLLRPQRLDQFELNIHKSSSNHNFGIN